MNCRVLAIHYTPPGVIGGVEHVLQQHASLLEARGFDVEVVAGRSGDTSIPLHIIPEIDAALPESKRVENELEVGVVSPRFHRLRRAIVERLTPLVEQADIVVAHNAFTLHFSLPLTSVLWDLAARGASGKFVAWCHDLSWVNPLYRPVMHDDYPWNLLRFPSADTRYVVVSEERRRELAELWGGRGPEIAVVPNGIDAASFLRLSPLTRSIVDRYQLFDRDIVLLLPVRITRRKNVEAAIRAVRNLKDRGLNVCFLVTGPRAPHHPGRSSDYLEELCALRAELDLVAEVVFLAESLAEPLSSDTVSELYSMADALLFPSAHEGFGIPILEAALARAPVVLSDIPIFREIGGADAWTFDVDGSADRIAEAIIDAVDGRPARLFRRVRRDYRWDVIIDRQVVPLLQRSESPAAKAR